MLNAQCANDKNDFAIFDEMDECYTANRAKIMTCARGDILVDRMVDKWFKNEQFEFDADAKDCEYVK